MTSSVMPENVCRHNPPASAAEVRLDTYKNAQGPPVYEWLGGARKNYPACVVSFGDVGKLFARELGGYLTHQGQKDVIYARLSPDNGELGPLNGSPLKTDDLKDRKVIVTSDCLTPEEREMVDKRLGELRKNFGFVEVAYALERE